MNINVNTLKETFYTQFYKDYKGFLYIRMGTEIDHATNKYKVRNDVYSKTLAKYKAVL